MPYFRLQDNLPITTQSDNIMTVYSVSRQQRPSLHCNDDLSIMKSHKSIHGNQTYYFHDVKANQPLLRTAVYSNEYALPHRQHNDVNIKPRGSIQSLDLTF